MRDGPDGWEVVSFAASEFPAVVLPTDAFVAGPGVFNGAGDAWGLLVDHLGGGVRGIDARGCKLQHGRMGGDWVVLVVFTGVRVGGRDVGRVSVVLDEWARRAWVRVGDVLAAA